MDKIKMSEAKKMEREGYNIMHIDWFDNTGSFYLLQKIDLQKKYPDCSHVLISPNKLWADNNAIAALILDDDQGKNNNENE